MLAIRMQRTGRKGHAQFRLIVQDKRFSPTSGRVVAQLGSYDPHSKAVKVDTEKAAAYLKNGAQPTDRVATLLKKEGVKLPVWVKPAAPQKRAIKKQDKLRRNRPAPTAESEPRSDSAGAGEPETTKEEAPEAKTEAAPENVVADNESDNKATEQPEPTVSKAIEAPPSELISEVSDGDSAVVSTEETPLKALETEALKQAAAPQSAEPTAPEPEPKSEA